MANFNFIKVMLGGRLCEKPELKTSQGGTSHCGFRIAVNRRSSNGNNETDFINCKSFNKTAETVTRYFNKGSSIFVEGRIQTGSYTKQDGSKVYTTDVMVDNVFFVDSKNDSSVVTNEQSVDTSNVQPAYMPTAYGVHNNNASAFSLDDDDGLPF